MSSRPTQQFVKGQTIVLEGAEGDRTFKILSGEVLICKRNSAAELVPIARLGSGEIFGEMYLFEGCNTRTATAIAASNDVELEVYFREEMQAMINHLSPAMVSILHGFSRRLQRTSDRCAELQGQATMSRLPDGTMRQSGTSIRRQS